MAAIKAADPTLRCVCAAIDEPIAVRAYGSEVRWRIRQGDPESYRAAAAAINEADVDIVNVQHEFGLYGVHREGTYHDHLRHFLDEIDRPVVTTLHTVLPRPEPWMRQVVREIADDSREVVVMAKTAARLLRDVYGIERPALVIPHGMPATLPRGRQRLKRQLGIQGRTLISTFGLVDPRKGIEYMIEALPKIVARHPHVLYLIVGQTHPELLKQAGEAYRNSLIDAVKRAGVDVHVGFVNQYLTQREIVEYLLATDVYVTPYLDPNQITSGTLAYALGAGKAIVSTGYLHAAEALADGRGILVDFRDARGLADAVNAILDDPVRKRQLEQRAYAYGKEMAWPIVGLRLLELLRETLDPAGGVIRRARELAKAEKPEQEPTQIA